MRTCLGPPALPRQRRECLATRIIERDAALISCVDSVVTSGEELAPLLALGRVLGHPAIDGLRAARLSGCQPPQKKPMPFCTIASALSAAISMPPSSRPMR